MRFAVQFHRCSGARFCVLCRDLLLVVFLTRSATAPSELVSGLHRMEIPRLQLHPQADIPSNLFRCGTGRTPFTNCDSGKEPYCCVKLTPTFLRNDVASVFFRHVLVDKAGEKADAMTDDEIRESDAVRNCLQFFDPENLRSRRPRARSLRLRRQERTPPTSQGRGNSSNAARRC